MLQWHMEIKVTILNHNKTSVMTKKNASATKKASTAKTAKLDSKNLKKSTATAVAERETKYRYPADVTTKEQKKKFRRDARAAKAKLIAAVDAKEKGSKEALSAWEKKMYNVLAA
jgi:hypothetical protein